MHHVGLLYRIMSITETALTASCITHIIRFRPFWKCQALTSFDIKGVSNRCLLWWRAQGCNFGFSTNLSITLCRFWDSKLANNYNSKSIELNDIRLWSVGPMTDRKWTHRVQLAEKTWFGDVRDSDNMPQGTFFFFSDWSSKRLTRWHYITLTDFNYNNPKAIILNLS